MTRSRRLPLAAILIGLALALGLVASASAAVQTSDDRIETADPTSLTFHLRVSGDPVQDAVLTYRVLNPDGNVGGDLRAQVPTGGQGDLQVTLQTNSGATYIPVGSRISYHWELTTAQGEETRTEAQTFVFLDGRYAWQSMERDGVTVYWYASEVDAALALQATSDAITDVEALLDTHLPYPVRVVLWPRESEGALAQRARGGTFDSQVITGGSRVSSDLLHIYDALGSFVDVARHEAAHLVTKVAGDGPFTRAPSWLDEGVAVYTQTSPGAGYRTAVEFAVQTDNTLRLRNLAAPSNQASLVNTFYGQSWAVVAYLVETYGPGPLAEVFAAIKAGNTTDQAFLDVYGFDQDGLYNQWRLSVGLDPIEFSAAATTTPGAEGTRAPLTLPTSVAGGSSGGDGAASPGEGAEGETVGAADGGSASKAMTALIIGVATLVLAGGLGVAGMRLMRAKA
ncbi:MAG: peptidase MA family metallohydrolase [Dehalococcoidia bacterium]|nr:peptidase MA family metallohydrolase [Dehalococcoidia bacterium]